MALIQGIKRNQEWCIADLQIALALAMFETVKPSLQTEERLFSEVHWLDGINTRNKKFR